MNGKLSNKIILQIINQTMSYLQINNHKKFKQIHILKVMNKKKKIYLNYLSKELFLNIRKEIRIKEIMKDIQFVIIYGIMVQKFQKSGRINNIKTLREIKMEIERKHFMMHCLEEYQIKKTIIILIYKIKMEELQQCGQHMKVFFLQNNGNINLIYKIIKVIQLQYIQLIIVTNYLQSNGFMILILKMIVEILQHGI